MFYIENQDKTKIVQLKSMNIEYVFTKTDLETGEEVYKTSLENSNDSVVAFNKKEEYLQKCNKIAIIYVNDEEFGTYNLEDGKYAYSKIVNYLNNSADSINLVCTLLSQYKKQDKISHNEVIDDEILCLE